MTYGTGTVTDANPGPALYAAMEATFLAAGFTLADTVVISTRTHKVLKSDAADNDLGKTWYLDIHYPTTGITGGMFMAPFEDFNSTTDLGFRGPYTGASNTTIEGTYYSRFGATGSALESSWANAVAFTNLDNALTTGAMGWFLSATTDRVIFASTASAAELHYVGFFEPTADHVTAAGAALYPLIVAHFNTAASTAACTTSAAASMAFTRVPPMTAINWGTAGFIDIAYAQMGGTIGSGGNFAATGKTGLAKRPIVMGAGSLSSSSASTATGGLGLVGFLIDVANSWTDGTVQRGDDLTDTNADEWVGVDDSSNVGLWFRAV
jgi:hypothetical protein